MLEEILTLFLMRSRYLIFGKPPTDSGEEAEIIFKIRQQSQFQNSNFIQYSYRFRFHKMSILHNAG